MKYCAFKLARQTWAILRFFVVLSGTSMIASAQTDQGTIIGIVTDTSGAVVSGARVTLTSVDTGFTLTRQTDPSGVYTFSPIKIGAYRILVNAPGFAQMRRENLHLDIQQRLQVNFELKPGAATEQVEVTSAPPLMQSGGVPFHLVDAAHVLRTQKLWLAHENMAAIDSTTHTSTGGGLKILHA